nr:hypothetical protein [Tanacetum cinerariifolium]
ADQSAEACDDERVTLANLKHDIDENKKIQKQLKKANASLTQELKECKFTFEETNRTLWESNSTQDSSLIVLQNKQTELEKYKTYVNRTTENDTLKCKLKDTLGLLAQKENDINEVIRESAGSNDVVHNYYLEEAKKKEQLQKYKAMDTKPSVQQYARLPNTANGYKPKPRNFNQQPRN